MDFSWYYFKLSRNVVVEHGDLEGGSYYKVNWFHEDNHKQTSEIFPGGYSRIYMQKLETM